MSTNNSVTLHRVLTAAPDKVYRAFTEPGAMASWFPPFGFYCTIEEMDVRLGGHFKMSFTNFSTGQVQPFGGEYLELKQNELIKFSDSFDDPNLPGKITTTVELKKVSVGTEINILQENIPSQIPAEMCYLGWQESLEKLKKLVEPNIPG